MSKLDICEQILLSLFVAICKSRHLKKIVTTTNFQSSTIYYESLNGAYLNLNFVES